MATVSGDSVQRYLPYLPVLVVRTIHELPEGLELGVGNLLGVGDQGEVLNSVGAA